MRAIKKSPRLHPFWKQATKQKTYAAVILALPKWAILEYVVTDDKTYLFVLTADGEAAKVKSGNLPSADYTTYSWHLYPININKPILAYHVSQLQSLIINNRSGYAAYCQFLYNVLLEPAKDQLAGKSSLIIIPDSVLWSLPFQALQPAPDHFLIETYNLSYVPSLSILNQAQKLRNIRSSQPLPSTQKDVLVMGTPNNITQVVQLSLLGRTLSPYMLMDKDTKDNTNDNTDRLLLKPLPGAADEINMMPDVYGGRVEKIIGPNASKAVFQRIAGRYRIIHLATHGILISKNPMESSIVLAPTLLERANNGPKKSIDATKASDKILTISSEQLLSAREVMEMRLQADLVVLSACDTAGGGVSEGEGMIGLTWAFAAAGVPTIVASQWAVSDRTTADLMEDFHRRLQKYRQKNGVVRSTAAALSEAERGIAKTRERRHPYYWAAFIVVGNGQ